MTATDMKNLNIERIDKDDAVFALVVAEGARAKYEKLNDTVPEWLSKTIRNLKRVIDERKQEETAQHLSTLLKKIEAQKSPAERKRELQEQLAQIESGKA
jgi:hypothetical protein